MNRSFGEFFQPFLNTGGAAGSGDKGRDHRPAGGFRHRQHHRHRACFPCWWTGPTSVRRKSAWRARRPCSCSTLRLRPKFPPNSFSADYLPSLVREMKRRDASINGTFSDATARLEDGKIVVTLAHGGADLMRQRHVDRLMSRVICRGIRPAPWLWISTASPRWMARAPPISSASATRRRSCAARLRRTRWPSMRA